MTKKVIQADKIEILKPLSMYYALRFVAAARATKVDRARITGFTLEQVQINKDCICATDGRRLHIVHIKHDYTPGLYTITALTPQKIVLERYEEVVKYPEWRDFIPDHKDNFTLDGVDFTSFCMATLGRVGLLVNYKYLKPFEDSLRTWTIYYPPDPDTNFLGIGFVSEEKDIKYQAVLMPINWQIPKTITDRSRIMGYKEEIRLQAAANKAELKEAGIDFIEHPDFAEYVIIKGIVTKADTALAELEAVQNGCAFREEWPEIEICTNEEWLGVRSVYPLTPEQQAKSDGYDCDMKKFQGFAGRVLSIVSDKYTKYIDARGQRTTCDGWNGAQFIHHNSGIGTWDVMTEATEQKFNGLVP
jgi:hypothetical protein